MGKFCITQGRLLQSLNGYGCGATSSGRTMEKNNPSTSTETCEASTSTEADVEMGRSETLTSMEKESNKVSIGKQTVSFCEVINLLAQIEAELQDLKGTLEEKEFVPENIKDDSEMKALTSFTRERFFDFFEFLIIETDLQKNTKRRPIDRFFLFFIKLRTGISNEFLSVLFGISESTVSQDFNVVASIMYAKLKLLDIFPTKSMVIEYMPIPFRLGNKDVRLIVDYIEFLIQKPIDLMEQELTFSHYRNTYTLKGMIGITPNGAISFISPLYCGSISDKQLFIRSKLMDHLEPNDVVMADKGLLIAEELENIGCKLQCPIFLEDKILIDMSEMISDFKLFNSEVTLERATSKVMQYKYFEGAIPYESLPHIDSVFFIACMLCNFHPNLNEII
ncbi:uncharacterized protein NPIL_518371 [Nephila pilipes]|uniref:DDE Tnp4 domain-containing protein n=1 Tax=Nephila pilipes TaxID=299642 RepID=A0A8X6TQT2_NEPPI|nr:uncharacterized protein NPIL_518371 [Nephila pilipes]